VITAKAKSFNNAVVLSFSFYQRYPGTYQVSMYCCLLDVSRNPSDVSRAVLKVGVKVGLVVYGEWEGLDAGLLVRQGELVQHIHVLEGICQGDLVPGSHTAPGYGTKHASQSLTYILTMLSIGSNKLSFLITPFLKDQQF